MPRGVLLVAVLVFGAGAAIADTLPNTLSEAERRGGWRLLFDGRSTDGFRNYRKDSVSAGWKVDDGCLVRADTGAGDLITSDEFDSFELQLDYRISPGGNSGLMFHVTEDSEKPWHSGPEVQIIDNAKGKDPQHAGWLYQLYAPTVDATKPVGEWNTVHILISPEKCVHTMNGTKYVEYVKGSADWDAKVAASKFSKFPQFGKPTKGFICLQDHGNIVSFRNVKIKVLD